MTAAAPPLVLWAQRADKVLLTIEIEDCKNPTIKLEKDKLYFRGKSDSISNNADHKDHEVTITFYQPVKEGEQMHVVKARGIEFTIDKEEAKWWPRLLKETTKQHWLKVDFLKWKDEDDSEDEMPAGMGAMGGMPGMGGMGGQPDFSDFLQQMGGMGGGGAGDLGGEEFDSDDEDEADAPPELV